MTAKAEGKGRRVAVLVGMQDYVRLDPLATPYQDIHALARMLRGLNFEVHAIVDGPRPQTSEAVRAKLIEVRPALAAISETAQPDDGSCVLFYFAGHGILHLDRVYLLDEEASLTGEAAIRSHAISLDEVLSDLNVARNIPKVVLLDCCQVPVQSGEAGLRLPNAIQHQTIIGFSTSPGRVAIDGRAQGLSPYATAIYRHFPTPGAMLMDVMNRVTSAVWEYTGGLQSAVHLATLCDPLVLAPLPEQASQKQDGKSDQSPAASGAHWGGTTNGASDGDVEESLHSVRVCKFRDDDGRAAWYVLLLNEGTERTFVAAAARTGGVDLTTFGRILAREYAEIFSEALCEHVESRYGPQVAAKLRSVRARLTQTAHAASGSDPRSHRSMP